MLAVPPPEVTASETRNQSTTTPERLEKIPNPAIVRLAAALRERTNEEDTVNYSRMHNRHNRG